MNTPNEAFAAALGAKMAAAFDDVHVSMPGRIESYDRALQKAVVMPLCSRQVRNERGDLESQPFKPITDVPVEFMGGGGYHLTFPLAAGMTCRLQFCSTSIDKFLAVGNEVDPKDERRFALSDAVCVVGLRDFAHAIKDLPSNAWCMVGPDGTEIRFGALDAAQKAIRGDAFKTAMDTFMTSLAAAINPIAGGGATAATAITAAKGVFDTAAATWLSDVVRFK